MTKTKSGLVQSSTTSSDMKNRKRLATTRKYLESIDKHVIGSDNDRVAAVIGDEGAGKSTYMTQMSMLWDHLRNGNVVADRVLNNILWGARDEFIKALREREPGSLICVQDAAHVLFSKEAMHGSQIEVEKSLLDVRIRNFLIVLGFQDFDDMPDNLKGRRVENVFYLETHRGQPTGTVKIYNRDSIDERYKNGEWPDEPDATDKFDSLKGTDIWERFNERDTEAKLNRLNDAQELDAQDVKRREQLKIGLRAIRPWDDDAGMTQSDAADLLLDYSQTWLSKRIKEWERGEWEGLLEGAKTQNVTRGEFEAVANDNTDGESQTAVQ